MNVKVMLAVVKQNPHVLILDEPMNYLDHEGLRKGYADACHRSSA